MAPQDEPLAIGDFVEVVDMPDSDMNGLKGTIVKTVGKGRWALKVEGDDRSKVVQTAYLRKCAAPAQSDDATAQAPKKYSIVGTWDDWEPSDLVWNKDLACFEARVTLGEKGMESFKILLDEDWDRCVYPDRKDANPHEPHGLKGPDDGGLDEEWSIGKHPADNGSQGSKYKVLFYVTPDGNPQSVTWEPMAMKMAPKPAPEPMHEPQKVAKKMSPRDNEDWESGDYGMQRARMPPVPPSMEREFQMPRTGGRGGNDGWRDSTDGDAVVAAEREARERLARRLEAADDAFMFAIQDEGVASSKADVIQVYAEREAEEVSSQILLNKARYRQICEDNQHSSRMVYEQRQAPKEDSCVECGAATDNMMGNSMCCEPCYMAYDDLRKEGWDSNVLCDGLPAGYRAQAYAADGTFSTIAARQYVMKKWERNFYRH